MIRSVIGPSWTIWQPMIARSSRPASSDVRIVPKAGHFSFMNTPPPGTADDAAFDRDRFLTDLAQATMEFATAS